MPLAPFMPHMAGSPLPMANRSGNINTPAPWRPRRLLDPGAQSPRWDRAPLPTEAALAQHSAAAFPSVSLPPALPCPGLRVCFRGTQIKPSPFPTPRATSLPCPHRLHPQSLVLTPPLPSFPTAVLYVLVVTSPYQLPASLLPFNKPARTSARSGGRL